MLMNIFQGKKVNLMINDEISTSKAKTNIQRWIKVMLKL